MVDSLIRWSLRNRAIVLGLACLLILAGAFTALRMPIDVFPDLTAPTVDRLNVPDACLLGRKRAPAHVRSVPVPPAAREAYPYPSSPSAAPWPPKSRAWTAYTPAEAYAWEMVAVPTTGLDSSPKSHWTLGL